MADNAARYIKAYINNIKGKIRNLSLEYVITNPNINIVLIVLYIIFFIFGNFNIT